MTNRQKLFIEEYLIDLNATQAAIRAGYSPDSAADIGSENLRKPDIKNAIDKAMAERSRRTGISQDRILQELAKIAFVNPEDVIDFDKAKVRDDATKEDLACIQSVKVKTLSGGKGDMVEREVKLYDKKAALELLGKHFGMFKENVNVNVEVSEKLDDILSQIGGEGLEE